MMRRQAAQTIGRALRQNLVNRNRSARTAILPEPDAMEIEYLNG